MLDRRALAALAVALAFAATSAEETKPTALDIASLRSAGNVTISADGRFVAYTVREPRFDPAAQPSDDDAKGGWKSETQLWIAPAEGGTPRNMTTGDEAVSSPAWSPD